MSTEKSTGRYEDVFYFIKSYITENGFAPSVRDVAGFLEGSTSLAQWYLDRLENRGYISRQRFTRRSIQLCRPEYGSMQQN